MEVAERVGQGVESVVGEIHPLQLLTAPLNIGSKTWGEREGEGRGGREEREGGREGGRGGREGREGMEGREKRCVCLVLPVQSLTSM